MAAPPFMFTQAEQRLIHDLLEEAYVDLEAQGRESGVDFTDDLGALRRLVHKIDSAPCYAPGSEPA